MQPRHCQLYRTKISLHCTAIVPVDIGSSVVGDFFTKAGFQFVKYVTVVIDEGTSILTYCVTHRNSDGAESEDMERLGYDPTISYDVVSHTPLAMGTVNCDIHILRYRRIVSVA